MSEENKSAEEIPQNTPRKGVEEVIKCKPGEAALAIKFRCVANGPGVEIHLDVATSHPAFGNLPNLPAMYLTLAAHNIVETVKELIKPAILNDGAYKAALSKTDDEFMKLASKATDKEADADETPATPSEEVPHGV